MTVSLSLICQIFSGSGLTRNTGTNYLSPGLAKIAPWWLAAGTVYRLKYSMTHRRAAPPTLTAHTSGPLYLSQNAAEKEILTHQWPKYNAISMD